jgi:hypothetical protein
VCTDIDALLERVFLIRQQGPGVIVKISVDCGGGFLKFSLSSFYLHESHNSRTVSKFISSGAHRAIIIGIAPDTQENYENVKIMWHSCGLEQLHFPITIACDLKLANIILGLMSHSSAHPCSWCTAEKHRLQDLGETRTVGLLRDSFLSHQSAGGKRECAKQFGNVVRPCLPSAPPTTPVLQLIPPPELHLMTGAVPRAEFHLVRESQLAGCLQR